MGELALLTLDRRIMRVAERYQAIAVQAAQSKMKPEWLWGEG